MSEPRPLTLTRAELAETYGVHVITICKWEQAGMPVHIRGTRGRPSMYRLPEVNRWYLARELAARGGVNGQGALSPLIERAKLDAARRAEVEQRVAARAGKLLDRDVVQREVVGMITTARNQLLGAHSRVKQRAPHLAIADVLLIETVIREILTELSCTLAEGAHGKEKDEKDDTNGAGGPDANRAGADRRDVS